MEERMLPKIEDWKEVKELRMVRKRERRIQSVPPPLQSPFDGCGAAEATGLGVVCFFEEEKTGRGSVEYNGEGGGGEEEYDNEGEFNFRNLNL